MVGMYPQRNSYFLVSQLHLVITGQGWFLSTSRDEAASAGRNGLGRFVFSAQCPHHMYEGSTPSPTMPLSWYKRHVKVIHLFSVVTPKPELQALYLIFGHISSVNTGKELFFKLNLLG